MADLIQTKLTSEGLARAEADRAGEADRAEGMPVIPETIPAENAEVAPTAPEAVEEVSAAPVKAAAQPAQQQDLSAVLETHSAQNVVNPESKSKLSIEAQALNNFLSGVEPAGDLLVMLKPDADSPDLPVAA